MSKSNIFKKNAKNTREIVADAVICDEKLVSPRLTTVQRDALNPQNGDIIYNTDTNKYNFYENGGWKEVVTGTTGGFMDLTTDQTVTTGKKTFTPNVIINGNLGLGVDPPTSKLHVKDVSPAIQVESTAGGTSQILMQGQSKNVLDMGFTSTLETNSGSGNLDIVTGGTQYARFDSTNKNMSIGENGATLPRVTLNVHRGASGDTLKLPKLTSAQVATLPVTSAYDGTLWYNETADEIEAVINNTVHKLHGAHTTSISEANIAGITTQPASVSDVQTFQNKTFTDDTTYFQDNADNSKKVQFELSGVTTATTRTLAVPDANTTVVGTDVTQTLTNKTIDADQNSLSNIDNSDIKTGANIDASKIADGSVSNIEYQTILGSKKFTNSGPTDELDIVTVENTSATLGNARASGILLKGSTVNNVTNEWSIYTEGNLDDTLCFYNYKQFPGAPGVKMSINNNSLNLNQAGQSYKIQGNDVLNATTLGSGILNSSLTSIGEQSSGLNISTGQSYKINNIEALSNTKLRLNNQDIIDQTTSSISLLNGVFQQISPSNNLCHFVNSDIRVDGATGNDAVVNIIRSTGETAKLKSTTAGYVVENNTQDLYVANNTGLDLLVGDYKKNGVNVLDGIPWTLTFQEFVTNSTTFVPVVFFLYTTGRVWNNITVVTNDLGAGDVQFQVFNVSQAINVVTSPILGPNLGVVTTTLNLGGGFPNQNDIIALTFRKNSGGGSKNMVCATIR